jgi:hypothetical protein
MTRTAQIIQDLFPTPEAAIQELNITKQQYSRLMSEATDFTPREWLIRIFIRDYNINPLYIVGHQDEMYLDKSLLTNH